MKHRSSALLALLLFFSSDLAFAQAVTPPDQTKKPVTDPATVAKELAAVRTGMGRAQDLAQANDVVAAEQALVAVNRTKPNTAAWHIETAQRLMQTVEQLARAGKPAAIPAMADSALQHLVQAEALAKDPRIKASAKQLAGFIHERFKGNREAALASYEAAAKLSPSSVRATEAASRLQNNGVKPVATPGGGGR